MSPFRKIRLGSFLKHRKEFFTLDDSLRYKRVRVQLHNKGIVLRDLVAGAELRTKKQQFVRTGDFLVAEIDAKVGGFGIVPSELDGAIVSSHYFLYDVDEAQCLWGWLAAFIRSGGLEDQVIARGTTNYAAIRPEHVLGFEIPLPPIDEQRRIVARIDELATQVEEARTLRQQAVEGADGIVTSWISALFKGKDCWTTVQNAISPKKGAVRSGPFGSQLLHEEFTDSGVAAIGTRDVQTNHFELRSGWFVSLSKFEHLRRYQVFPKDVLCTIVGASIGRFCVVPEDVPLAFTTKHVQALTLNMNVAEPRFICYMLNFDRRCCESLFSQVEGSAQPSLNAAKVLATRVPLPPLAEQRRIVAELDVLQGEVDSLKRLQAETAAELDALLPSILDHAFAGKL